MEERSLSEFFTEDHRACDHAWAALESSANAADTARSRADLESFKRAVEGNLKREEEMLFPAFERASGMTAGPTQVMRLEHRQMRAILGEMDAAAEVSDWSLLLDHGDTLLMLMQQHNAKEEGILFPMAERVLAAEWPELAAHLHRAPG